MSKFFQSHDRFIKGTDFSVPSHDVVDEARYSSVARGQSCSSPRPPTCILSATARKPEQAPSLFVRRIIARIDARRSLL